MKAKTQRIIKGYKEALATKNRVPIQLYNRWISAI